MRSFKTPTSRTLLYAGLGVFLFAPALARGQIASALLREDDELLPGETIDSLSNTAVNHVGGYACLLTTSGTGTLSRVWGNPTGGPGMLMRTEGTFGDFEQTSFESFYGMSDTGQLAYGTTSTRISSGDTGLDGVWLDDFPILHEEEPVPTLPGMFSTFNSRPGVTGDGVPYWVGGITDTQGGTSQNRVFFSGLGANVVIMGGDFLPGIAEPIDTGASNIDFDWRVSRFGTNWIDQVLVQSSSTDDGIVVINGVPVMAGGGFLRENSPVPAAVGGLPGELWDNFDFFGVNEAGDYLVTGDTNAASALDEFVLKNESIVLRDGDVLDLGGSPVTVNGSIEGGYMNEQGDWAVIWDVDDPNGVNVEALIFNGEIVLVEGDPVDWNGDGVIDAADNNGVLANFTGTTALTVGARVGGVVNMYFTADIDFFGTPGSSDDLEGFFCFSVSVGQPAIEAAMDIKPGSCPNPFNPKSRGVLPVGLLGAGDFDATQVDISTLQLSRADGVGGSVAPHEGPPGPHTVFADVGTPFAGELCDCHELEGDGIVDVSMKFKVQDLVDILELGNAIGYVELVLTGNLLDGTPFEARDCIWMISTPVLPRNLLVRSNAFDTYIEVSPTDIHVDGSGWSNFDRAYTGSTVVTLTAPRFHGSRPFEHWVVDGHDRPRGQRTIEINLPVTQTETTTAEAVYAPLGQMQMDGVEVHDAQ